MPTAKEPWRMTRSEYVDGHFTSPGMHKYVVSKALAEGKPVPQEVLKDYPDLAPITPEVTEEEYIKAELIKYRRVAKDAGLSLDIAGQTRILREKYRGLDVVSRLKATGLSQAEIDKLTPQQVRDKLVAIPQAEVTRRAEGPSPSLFGLYNTQYSLKQLQEVAKSAGLNPSGLKLDLLNQLIQKGVLR